MRGRSARCRCEGGAPDGQDPSKRLARRFRRPAVALVAMGTVVSFTLVAAGGSVTAGAAGGPKLDASGPASEGPYPWKYPATGNVSVGSGTTIGGQKCTPGTNQVDSPYAVPCIAKFTGNNGGATYRGVTSNEIILAQREFPATANSEEIAAEAKEAGAAPSRSRARWSRSS